MTGVPSIEEIRATRDPRLRLTLAGAKVLADQSFQVVAAGLSPERVTRVAGRTRRTFYDHFESKEDFLRAITALYLDTSPATDSGENQLPGLFALWEMTPAELGEQLRWRDGDLCDSIEQLAHLTYGEEVKSAAREIQLVGWMAGRHDPEIQMQLSDKYESVCAAISHLVENLFGYWHLQLREPWTPDTFASVLRALSDGLYVRSRIEPDMGDVEVFALAILSIITSAAIPVGSAPVSVRDGVGRLAEDVASAWLDQDRATQVDNAYERIVEAFRQELASRGMSQITINSVAKRCQLSPTMIAGTFSDTTDMLRAAVVDSLPSLLVEAEFDLTTDSISTKDAMRRHLARLGTWISTNNELARGILAVAASSPADPSGASLAFDLVSIMSEPAALIMRAGVERGQVRDDIELIDMAIITTELMLGRGGARPDFELDYTSDFFTTLLFDGVGRRD